MAEEFDIVRANLLPAATNVSDSDMLLVVQGGRLKRVLPSLMKGKPGDSGASAFLGVTATYIQWKQGAGGAWQNLISIAAITGPRGEKPVFRKVGGTLQMKYEEEPDSAYKSIFDREELKMKFSDLTPVEVDQLKLHFSDLSPADIALLQKPATDAATEVRKDMTQISQEANLKMTDLRQLEATVEEQEEGRENFYTQVQAKEQARQNNEVKRQDAAKAVAEAEAGRVTKEAERNTTFDAKVKEATEATAKTLTAEKAAITATGNTDKATRNAQMAANRLNALSDHRDEIRDGYWWRWNEETGEWYNTGEIAKGNVMYATFDVDPETGELSMSTEDEYTGASFELNNEGILSVII